MSPILCLKILAAGGLLFAFEHSTVAGKIVLGFLLVGSIFSWSVMVTKLRVVRFARKQTAHFRAAFRQDRQPLRLFENHARFPGSPLFKVYRAGCEEMTFHLLGSAEVDETFRARLETADKISPAQMGAVNAAMERAVGETALELESQMILLATAVSGSPFLGLLGTVWGVMDTFTGVAMAGSPNLASHGARRFGRAHYHGHVALRGDSGDVRLQLSRHQHPRHHRGDGQLRGRTRFRVRAQIRRSRGAGGGISAMSLRRYSQRTNLTTLSEINVTPLLDLAFVLLIIFIITTPLLENSVNLAIPSSGAANAPVDPAKVQTVSIDRMAAIKFNNEPVDVETLSARLTALRAANPDVAVVIRPDRELPVQQLISLMDVLQRAQITRVGIATKAETR